MLELFCALLKHHCKNLQRLNRGEQEFPSPAIFGNTGLQKSGMNFPLAFPFPKIGNGIFHSHSCSRKLGMEFSTCILIPENWEWNLPFQFPSFPVIPENTNIPFPFPKIGNGVFISVPVSKNCGWKFSLAILFPKFGNGICHSCSRSPKVILADPWLGPYFSLWVPIS